MEELSCDSMGKSVLFRGDEGKFIGDLRLTISDWRTGEEDGEWIMVNGEFLTRITLIPRMAPIGEREAVR